MQALAGDATLAERQGVLGYGHGGAAGQQVEALPASTCPTTQQQAEALALQASALQQLEQLSGVAAAAAAGGARSASGPTAGPDVQHFASDAGAPYAHPGAARGPALWQALAGGEETAMQMFKRLNDMQQHTGCMGPEGGPQPASESDLPAPAANHPTTHGADGGAGEDGTDKAVVKQEADGMTQHMLTQENVAASGVPDHQDPSAHPGMWAQAPPVGHWDMSNPSCGVMAQSMQQQATAAAPTPAAAYTQHPHMAYARHPYHGYDMSGHYPPSHYPYYPPHPSAYMHPSYQSMYPHHHPHYAHPAHYGHPARYHPYAYYQPHGYYHQPPHAAAPGSMPPMPGMPHESADGRGQGPPRSSDAGTHPTAPDDADLEAVITLRPNSRSTGSKGLMTSSDSAPVPPAPGMPPAPMPWAAPSGPHPAMGWGHPHAAHAAWHSEHAAAASCHDGSWGAAGANTDASRDWGFMGAPRSAFPPLPSQSSGRRPSPPSWMQAPPQSAIKGSSELPDWLKQDLPILRSTKSTGEQQDSGSQPLFVSRRTQRLKKRSSMDMQTHNSKSEEQGSQDGGEEGDEEASCLVKRRPESGSMLQLAAAAAALPPPGQLLQPSRRASDTGGSARQVVLPKRYQDAIITLECPKGAAPPSRRHSAPGQGLEPPQGQRPDSVLPGIPAIPVFVKKGNRLPPSAAAWQAAAQGRKPGGPVGPGHAVSGDRYGSQDADGFQHEHDEEGEDTEDMLEDDPDVDSTGDPRVSHGMDMLVAAAGNRVRHASAAGRAPTSAAAQKKRKREPKEPAKDGATEKKRKARDPATISKVTYNCVIIIRMVSDQLIYEKEIRSALGNNPDTSKALRLLVQQGKLVRSGVGGRGNPFCYRCTPLGLETLRKILETATEGDHNEPNQRQRKVAVS